MSGTIVPEAQPATKPLTIDPSETTIREAKKTPPTPSSSVMALAVNLDSRKRKVDQRWKTNGMHATINRLAPMELVAAELELMEMWIKCGKTNGTQGTQQISSNGASDSRTRVDGDLTSSLATDGWQALDKPWFKEDEHIAPPDFRPHQYID